MIKLDIAKIKALEPCQNRLDNFLLHYPDFSGDIVDFLSLEHITPQDKIWVAVRVMGRFDVEVFALDCAFSAADAAAYAADASAAYAAYAAAYAYAYAADAADAADDAAAAYAAAAAAYAYAAYAYAAAAAYAERERQVDALIYLNTKRRER